MTQEQPAGESEVLDFLLLPDFSMMAFSSAVEPLRAANQLAGRALYGWSTFSLDGKPVAASNGVVVTPEGALGQAGEAGTLFVCAGNGAERFDHEALNRRLRALSARRAMLGGLCTGAIALARAGLLEGYRCTIHWENVEGFAEEFPELDITATLFELDRDRITCSGGTAPLDMMINKIAGTHGGDLGVKVAEMMLHHAVRHPHDVQRMPIQYRTGITHPKLLAAIAHMEAFIESPARLAEIAGAVSLSPRQLERLFRQHIGKKPTRYYMDLRLQRARLLLRQTTMSITQIAVATGFASASHFTRSYGELFERSPREERLNLKPIPL